MFFNMKVCFVFAVESPYRGDSNENTQHTIFNVKKKITLKYPKPASTGFLSKGLKNEFETTVVNEPSVLEPLKVYCTCGTNFALLRWYVSDRLTKSLISIKAYISLAKITGCIKTSTIHTKRSNRENKSNCLQYLGYHNARLDITKNNNRAQGHKAKGTVKLGIDVKYYHTSTVTLPTYFAELFPFVFFLCPLNYSETP